MKTRLSIKISLYALAIALFYGFFLFIDKVPSATGWWTVPTLGVILGLMTYAFLQAAFFQVKK